MKLVFDAYAADEAIPVERFIKNRKLVKYFNRETAAALVAAGKLFGGAPPSPSTPFYYETGVMEFENLGLEAIARNSRDGGGTFSQRRFVEQGTKAVPPLTQFKALYNMPLSFVSIEHGLTGDNAVLYGSARALLLQALCAPTDEEILLGSGKVMADGRVECGFALVTRHDLEHAPSVQGEEEGIALFRRWHPQGPGQ